MINNAFKIYDGRTNFWQWDTKQKLIVLDDKIFEVRFANKDSKVAERKFVYTNEDGVTVCDVPDSMLQQSKTLFVYGCTIREDGSSAIVALSKIAVLRQPMPEASVSEELLVKIAILETQMKNIEKKTEIPKFETQSDAQEWAIINQQRGIIVLIKDKEEWVAHTVNNDYTVSPVCNTDSTDSENTTISLDGGDSFELDGGTSSDDESVNLDGGSPSDESVDDSATE